MKRTIRKGTTREGEGGYKVATMSEPGDVLELKKMLRDKMEAEGWDNVRNFCKQTRIPISSTSSKRTPAIGTCGA